jgi:hypothetical protein
MCAALKHPNVLPLSGYSDDFGDFGALVSPVSDMGVDGLKLRLKFAHFVRSAMTRDLTSEFY